MFFRILYRLAPFTLAAYAVLLAALSLLPSSGPGMIWDKLAHTLAYALFPLAGAPLALLPASGRRPLLLLSFGAAAWGILLEIAQHFVPGRVMSLADVAANCLGVLIGVGILALSRRVLPLHRARRTAAEGSELG